MDLRSFLSAEKATMAYSPPHCFELCGKSFNGDYDYTFYEYPSREVKIGGGVYEYDCFKAAGELYFVAYNMFDIRKYLVFNENRLIYPSNDLEDCSDLEGNTVDLTFGPAPESTLRLKFGTVNIVGKSGASYPKIAENAVEPTGYTAFRVREGVYIIGIQTSKISATLVADFTCDLVVGADIGAIPKKQVYTPIGGYAQIIAYEE